MIKGILTNGSGDNIVLLGLPAEDLARLMSRQPIVFDLAEVGLPPQTVVLVGGPDEEAIAVRIRTDAHLALMIREP